MRFDLLWVVVFCGIAALSSHASAYQPIAPGENTKIIESFHVKSDIRYRFATTQMSSLVRNIADVAQEISFDVILPKEAFIVSFFMEIDGKIYDGEVKEKSKAKKEYQAAVDKGQSAGHIRQAPRHSNIFEVSVNVANGSAVNFTLTYQEILQRKFGLYDHEIHINPGQPVKDFFIEVYIQENKPINFVKTPALRTDALITNEVEADNQLTVVERPSPQTAHVSYRPPLAEQGKDGLSARFSVQYDVDHSAAGDVLVVDGYFVHFFAPDLPPMPKDIVFVLDVSGSMYGTKIKQLKTAMTTILNDLQTEDRFNIITFNSRVRRWKSGLMMAEGETMKEAKQFVKGMGADGMTDINSALLTAISELRGREDKTRVPMIFFLTDGEPTIGIQDAQEIAANVFCSNEGTATIFSLAFGEGANYDSLKTISTQNSGFARKIYEASDAAIQVTSLYQEVSAVVMKDISVAYLNSSVDDYTLTKTDFPVVFNGSEIIICGVFTPQADTFELEINGVQKSGEVSLVLEVDDIDNIILTDDNLLNPLFTTPRDYAGIVERMWAYLTIKQLLMEKEKHISDEHKAKELNEKALEMSLKYKFVTPLTSMVVTKPEESDTPVESGLRDADDIKRTANGIRRPAPSGASLGWPYSLGRPYGHSQIKHHLHISPPLLPPYWSSMYGPRRFGSLVPGNYDPSHYPSILLKLKATTTTTTTTTTTPTTTTSVSSIINRVSAFNGSKIMTLTYHDGDTSICLVPRKIKPATYELLLINGMSVQLQTDCTRNCQNVLLKEVSINHASGHRSLLRDGQFVPIKDNARSRGRPFSNEGLAISESGVTVTLSQMWKKNPRFISIDISVDPVASSSGLIGSILRNVDRFQSKKQPRRCRIFSPEVAVYLFKKRAQRFVVVT